MVGFDFIEEAFLMDLVVGHMNTEAFPPIRTVMLHPLFLEKLFKTSAFYQPPLMSCDVLHESISVLGH